MSFAKKYHLVYFHRIDSHDVTLPVVLGSTAREGRQDSNVCIGSHAGYDLVLMDRIANIAHEGYETTLHRWYVLQIDIKNVKDLPFIFVGTKQQSKAYYAEVLLSDPQLHYLILDTNASKSSVFHGNYAILASPDSAGIVSQIFNDEVVDSMGQHLYPFSVEISGDSIIVATEVQKPNQQLMSKLLHYGLWFAKEVDKRFD